MIRIIDDRSTGKTCRLMMIAKETDAVFVCSNPYAMEQKAKAYGITGITFMSYYDFINNSRGKRFNYVVDELESLVSYFSTPNTMIGYTQSKEK